MSSSYRDGHTATWWAADATLGFWGPDGLNRLVVATTAPATLPEKSTWYLVTDLPRPGGPRVAESPHPPAGLAEVVRIYGIRNWIEQSYKQVKDELGWADFQVRTDRAIRRHQTLVNCAFSFCWHAGLPTCPGRRPAGVREGAPDHPSGLAGPRLCGPSAAGSPRPSCCNAGGKPGPARPRRHNCRT
ncbi:hypothetical protein GCM10010365_72710 [Streptomyces poonensis]|uniref:Transposase n=1 Tax=Streptomyces poonensis TaxID=68255 RepID=A0A918QCE9_9ACTN|nr:hypothetical protein [Streptomyces poonensis]GGZ41460.1 hypothetical protein GCM10010365_72710 [Streptomyces poonensis]